MVQPIKSMATLKFGKSWRFRQKRSNFIQRQIIRIIKALKALVWHFLREPIDNLKRKTRINEEQADANKPKDEQAQGRTYFGMNAAK